MKLASRSQVTDFIDDRLKPDGAGNVDCSDIPKFGPQPVHGFEGFLVIDSTQSLDVVAVYTAAGGKEVGAASTWSTSGSGSGRRGYFWYTMSFLNAAA